MKPRPKEPSVPPEREETDRRKIMDILSDRPQSARDISVEAGISMKEVYGHLEHIQKTLGKKDHRLVVIPSECKKCGFVFRKRERLNKPGKCPVCRSESIEEPLFSIKSD